MFKSSVISIDSVTSRFQLVQGDQMVKGFKSSNGYRARLDQGLIASRVLLVQRFNRFKRLIN